MNLPRRGKISRSGYHVGTGGRTHGRRIVNTRSGAPRPTIYDVARRAEVSKSLVSLVLRNSPLVSDTRRAAVLEAINALGYRPSRAASALASNRSRSVGVLIDDYRNLWFVALLNGIRAVFDEEGYHVVVSDLDARTGHPSDPIDAFVSLHVDGLIIAAEPSAIGVRDLDLPAVVVGGRELRIPGTDVVANDDRTGAALAVGHLRSLGHARIGHVSGSGGAAKRRREGYADAMRAAGLEPMTVGSDRSTNEEDGYAGAMDLLTQHSDITAVFAANDTMAMGAVGALRDRGPRVPDDVSVMGYDNSPLAHSRLLDLTTIDDRSEAVGRDAAIALLTRLDHPSTPAGTTLLRPCVVERSSTRRIAD